MKLLRIILSVLILVSYQTEAAQRNLTVANSDPQPQKRVALVIGNAAYQSAPALRNPVNDARAISNALNVLDFEVIEVTNATQKEMLRAVTAFGSKLDADTVALFFYAGHGLQVKGKNYIIPVDAQIKSESAVFSESVSMNTVLEQINVSTVSIVILDACRNNPFERSFRKIGGGGLAQMDAPKGSFIAYATAPGRTAADGDGRHGLFTQELLRYINEPGLPLESVFKRVRASVATRSGDAQIPWDSSSMTGEFFFKPAKQGAEVTATPHVAGSQMETGLQEQGSTTPPADAMQAERDCAGCPIMVRIPGTDYEIGKYEVTQGEWKAVMGTIPEQTFKYCGDTCPVEHVSWNDIQKFIRKLNAMTGRLYRLPTEAEWEHACYGGNRTKHCGSDDPDAIAWYGANSGGTIHPAGEKQPNGYGLYDMSGNLWEWMQDCYDRRCEGRAGRGGSWRSDAYQLLPSTRNSSAPGEAGDYIGFRLARTLP